MEFCCHLLEECIRQRKKRCRQSRQQHPGLSEGTLRGRKTNLEKIAEKIGLTSAYISTIFKKETGMTITNYPTRSVWKKPKK